MYSRPDFFKISELCAERVENILLHIPVFDSSNENLDVFILPKRFCSFGSTWNKKINHGPKKSHSERIGKYLTIDVTDVFTNPVTRELIYNEGFILKKSKTGNQKIVISTGDSYSAPQILEIKYK